MDYLRLIKTDYTYAELSTSASPAVEKAMEEGGVPSTLMINYFSRDSITTGVLEDPEKSVDLKFCHEKGIMVRRRQNPGGAIFANQGSYMLCLYLHLSEPWVPFKSIREAFPFYLERMAQVIAEQFSLESRYRPVNDIEVKGRKLVATSARLEKGVLTLRSLVNVTPVDRKIMSGALIARPEKFKDKVHKDAGSRFTCLEEEAGRPIERHEMYALAENTMKRVFGPEIEIREGALTSKESQYLKQLQDKFSSDEWFFANSERTRFKNANPAARKVEAFHKAPAGLMGVVILALEGRVDDLILLADFHPSPMTVLAQMEDAIRGQPLEIKDLMDKVGQVYNAPGVEIPGTDLKDFETLLDKAIKLI
ncbi:MAG: lipoate--protein ligase family protein [Desulfobacteraceae bacterium]|jgi:lipoate-protein ligase A|nr:MAG: lipoate--protein ligase family protein [Desulfobacteraceae bacterium]